jgi:hypothetical protein
MPEQIKAYRCNYRCGHSPFNNIKDCEKHEKYCYRNPAQKACIICWYFQYGDEANECHNYTEGFEPPEMYNEKGICYNCDGFDQNGPE